MRRFGGAAFAAVALIGVVAVAWWPQADERDWQPGLLAFDSDRVVRIEVARPDGGVTLVRGTDGWSVEGEPWRPRRQLVRRILHQLHALRGRSVVAPEAEPDFELGAEAPRVTVRLADGREHGLVVGAANPTGVSHYVQVLPSPEVFLVARAAVEMFHWPVTAYREDRPTAVDHDAVVRFEARFAGQYLDVERGPDGWWIRSAVPPLAGSNDQLSLILGRLTGIRVRHIVEEAPPDLAEWGLAAATEHATVWGREGVLWSARFAGAPADETCWMVMQSETTVYEVTCGVRDAIATFADDVGSENDRDVR